MSQRFIKDPDSQLDYAVDWASWLNTGATIATSAWTVPAGITEVTSGLQNADTKAVVTVSGGTVGNTYALVNRITTSDGLTDDRTIYLTVTEK